MPTNEEWAQVHEAALAELKKGKKVATDVIEAIEADIEHLRHPVVAEVPEDEPEAPPIDVPDGADVPAVDAPETAAAPGAPETAAQPAAQV